MEYKTPFKGLGKLQSLKDKLGSLDTRADNYGLILFAGDNGVSCEGISLYPPMQSASIVWAHLKGKCPTSYMLNRLGKPEYIVDVGLTQQIKADALLDANICRGTRNFLTGDALAAGQVVAGLELGHQLWDEINTNSFDIIGVGEIAVASTLCAAAIATVLLGQLPIALVGRGSLTSKVISQKTDIISKAIKLRRPDSNSLIDILSRFGGLEIAALVGFISRAPLQRKLIMLDGFVTAVAALLATILDSNVSEYIIAPSLTDERGHKLILERLRLTPILDLNINFGEGLASVIGLFLAEMVTSWQ